MAKFSQERSLRTHAALLTAAREIVVAKGYQGLRIEDVVQAAGVAKGTFFSHFKDKDALMDKLIGAEIDAHLDQLQASSPPESVETLVNSLMPLLQFMTHEKYVFDLVLRFSGAGEQGAEGVIAQTFCRQETVVAKWLHGAPFRKDISVELMAEGVQAFAIHAMALGICELHDGVDDRGRLTNYLTAWLLPASNGAKNV